MCNKCKIDYPRTADFYTTFKGIIRTYICRSCHSKLIKERYDKKKKEGYRLKMIKIPYLKDDIENQKEAP